MRAETWRALEDAQQAGKMRYIGVSNYHPMLIAGMLNYARVMPCINQLEFHPRFSSPELQLQAKELGFVLIGYGSMRSVKIEDNRTVKQIAARRGTHPAKIVLRWTLQKGVVIIPRSTKAKHIVENLDCASPECALSAEEVAALDNLNENHPYYWSPSPTVAWSKL